MIAQAVAGVGAVAQTHGQLQGLAADDHPQYLTVTRAHAHFARDAHNHAHGGMTGLASDDHPQYPDLRRVVVDVDAGQPVIDCDTDPTTWVEAA